MDKDSTTIVEGAGKKTDIEARVRLLRAQMEEATSDYDREKLQERLAKLVGRVAIIKVGADGVAKCGFDCRADAHHRGNSLRVAREGCQPAVSRHTDVAPQARGELWRCDSLV